MENLATFTERNISNHSTFNAWIYDSNLNYKTLDIAEKLNSTQLSQLIDSNLHLIIENIIEHKFFIIFSELSIVTEIIFKNNQVIEIK
ncbi:hypothetical protein ETN89_14965 [Photobacterium damselae subsp. damselae]|uniref:hypothetical protein n=1 Tax=Photobacterium damselae TaxID=38293 RepID=UPI001010C42D|nr:hypothetical protein [Photobacterium damselae]QAY36623.1 hypothetical protein ETN89_14965 [Photobacterium damselae subsp. damselae]QOQ70796.1 hypothetical protein IL982_15660 [Photobacterium damselae subsp. damselae]